MTLLVAPASHQAAHFAVRAWHYSRSLPTPPLVTFGVWEGDQFGGGVTFSRGANRHLGAPFGLPQTAVAELSRVALRRGHVTPVSRIVAIALRLLRRQCPGLRLVVSFADPAQGHHGGIYQAMGWTYLGSSPPSTVYVDGHGRRWHPRMVSTTGVKRVYGVPRRVAKIAECAAEPVPGKHRYAVALDPVLRERLLKDAQPYPRPNQQAPVRQTGLAGATPSRPLHLGGGHG